MRVARFFISVATLAAFACPLFGQKEGEVERVAPSPAATKGQVLEWTSEEGKPYWYRLPAKIRKESPPHLIFMLHGTGLRWGWAFWNYPIAKGHFRGSDIVVAPEGMTPGANDTFNFIQGKTDGEQIANLIRTFRSKFPIGKVYLYGHSQGAFFCYWFAGAYPELVDGIVAHAGNVLDVRHSQLAKEKVAIGILHGAADAVVPVDCAYRTEKIYTQQGYKKIKLYIVEGLTERSGHWPLPRQVAEMFEWLDRVNADSPELALSVALAELAKANPDLSIIAEATFMTKRLLKRKKGEKADAMKAKLTALLDFIEEVALAHATTIDEAKEASSDAKDAYEPWMAHFCVANRALVSSSQWRKAVKSLASKARKQDRRVGSALEQLDAQPGRKSLRQAITTLAKSPLATEATSLERTLARLAAKPPAGMTAADFEAFRQVTSRRAEPSKVGQARATEVTARHASSFREAHPDWMPNPSKD